MLLFVAVLGLALATVPLAGGRLSRLADVHLRAVPAIAAAIVLQVLVLGVAPGDGDGSGWHVAGHLASYGLAGWFVWANRRVPGAVLLGLGGAMNLAAIAANGGVMPASRAALDRAGLEADGGAGFDNSVAIDDARLSWLGDVIAVPASWPLSGVFSAGDVLIALGLAVALHALSGSRLVPLRGAKAAERDRDDGEERSGPLEERRRGRGAGRGRRGARA
jgi:hypothetical protein